MNIQLIADSCCDTTPALRAALGLRLAPLKITVDGVEFVDDVALQVPRLLAAMKATKNPVKTAAPAPEDYAALMRDSEAAIVVTLSAALSGSYNAALAGRAMVLEENPEKKIQVFDSKSASAGELRIVMEMAARIEKGADFDTLCREMPAFIDGMRTNFVLEDLSTLVKNGRIPRMAGVLGSMLMMRPIMGENGEGEIVSVEKIRGTKQALTRLVALIAERTAERPPKSLGLTLSFCNCPDRALQLKRDFLARCPALGEVIMAPTSGLSTCYANNGGIVVACG